MNTADCYPEKAKTIDEILDVLSHHLRREVVHYFENITDSVTAPFDAVVSHIASRVPESDRQDLSVVLHHHHIPLLKSEGWLDYDRRSKEIRYFGHEALPQLMLEVTAVFTE